ncbi:hypothetical protein ACTXNP_18245 [Pseudomonas helleri]|uniref:Uncharacterized protein n=1 Tax=Pseudomonas helleri TaxID=1608996 RepID=A0A7X2BU45_9PSED|nr:MULTISPECIES: hypothetical protein [Pseudomonas]MQT74951.1 hypothetical protein [Pseudomonas helleri]
MAILAASLNGGTAMDTIVLYGPDDREESFSLPPGPPELVDEEIDRIVQDPDNAWAEGYEFYSHGSQVDSDGFPIYADD